MAAGGPGTRWRTPAILAGSVALHAVVLGILGLRAIQMDAPTRYDRPTILLEIEPRPMLRDERPRERSYAAPDPADAEVSPQTSTAFGPRRPQDDEDEAPSPPSPRATATAPGAPTAVEQGIDDAWRVPTSPTRRQVGRSLRGSMIGCDMMNGSLSAGEQAQCDEAFNRVAGAAPAIAGSGNAERDARFAAEGRRNIESYEARRRPAGGGTGLGEHGDCPGSNFGTGCPGRHLDPGWRRDNNDMMKGAQGGYSR